MAKISPEVGLAEARLGNYGNSLGRNALSRGNAPGSGVFGFAGREGSLRLRESLWEVSSLADLRKCGRVAWAPVLEVVRGAQGVNLRGLVRCHSVWSCPMCAPAIRSQRAERLASAVRVHLEEGAADFLTLTVPHSISDSLPSVFSVVASAWERVQQSSSVRAFKKAHGFRGFVRTVEVTYSRRGNGWHPHIHALEFWNEPLTLEELSEYRARVFAAWRAAVVRLGAAAPSSAHGVHLVPVLDEEPDRLAEYLLAAGVAHELTAISTKTGTGSGLTPFEILAQVASGNSDRWLPTWHAYEQGTRGRRMLGATRGLLASLEVEEENGVLEEEAVAELLATVSSASWRRIGRGSGGVRGVQHALEVTAVEGGQSAVDLLVGRLLGVGEGVIS